MAEQAWKLPTSDREFVALLTRYGGRISAVARVAQCSPEAVRKRIGQIRDRQPALLELVESGLVDPDADLTTQIAGLTRAVEELRIAVLLIAERPVQVVEWHANHRRVTDGGEPVYRQRRRLKREVREGAAPWQQPQLPPRRPRGAERPYVVVK